MARNDGKYLEKYLQDLFTKLRKSNPEFNFERHYDSTSAGKLVQAKIADFFVCKSGKCAWIECKSTANKNLRLDKPTQLPGMKLWEIAGVRGFLLCHFHIPDVLKLVPITMLDTADKSYDCSGYKTIVDDLKTIKGEFITTLLEDLKC